MDEKCNTRKLYKKTNSNPDCERFKTSSGVHFLQDDDPNRTAEAIPPNVLEWPQKHRPQNERERLATYTQSHTQLRKNEQKSHDVNMLKLIYLKAIQRLIWIFL